MNDITDPLDGIVRRNLKNWVAQHTPPANLRARILLLATSPLTQKGLPVSNSQADFEHYIPPTHNRPPTLWGIGPLHQNMLWALDLTLIPIRIFP